MDNDSRMMRMGEMSQALSRLERDVIELQRTVQRQSRTVWVLLAASGINVAPDIMRFI